MPSDVIMPMGADFYDQQIEEHRQQAERVRAVFDRLTKGEPYVAEWRSKGSASAAYEPIASGIIAESRAADLVIVSQATDGSDPPMLTDVPQRLALESGRPVLVVPTAWKGTAFGERVSIAWNNSREAARAVFDSLPLLKRASSIKIITAGEDRDDDDGVPRLTAADIAASLDRHGLKTEIDPLGAADTGTAGASLLARAAANRSDLLVMGAYGHSRMREFILGGATRHVLKNMTMPVLMSH
jgi:nucleotide-binding universal stress UspA family protein